MKSIPLRSRRQFFDTNELFIMCLVVKTNNPNCYFFHHSFIEDEKEGIVSVPSPAR